MSESTAYNNYAEAHKMQSRHKNQINNTFIQIHKKHNQKNNAK